MPRYCVSITFRLALVLAMVRPAVAQVPDEWLAPGDRATLAVVETERTERRAKTVFVGRGETTTDWTRRLTIWSFARPLNGRADFIEWATRIRQEIIADCPNVRASDLRVFDWSGRAAAEFLIVCPLYPRTGRQDIYLVRSIFVGSGILSAAVTFQQAPTEALATAARAWLDTLLLCTATTANPACR